MRPPQTDMQKELAEKALFGLLEECNMNKYEMARMFGVSRNTVSWWFTRGYIGRKAARDMDRLGMFSMKEMRPDLFEA